MVTIKAGSKLEYFIVLLLFGGIVMPMRLVILNTVGNNWYGSLGILTAVTITLIILAKKNRLGFFGPMYIRFVTRLHSAKWKKLAYSITGMFIITSSIIVVLVNEGHNESEYWKFEIERQIIGYGHQLNSIKDKALSSQIPPISFPEDMVPNERQMVTAMFGVVDDATGGWFLHFYTIMLIEQTEVAFMLIFTRLTLVKHN